MRPRGTRRRFLKGQSSRVVVQIPLGARESHGSDIPPARRSHPRQVQALCLDVCELAQVLQLPGVL